MAKAFAASRLEQPADALARFLAIYNARLLRFTKAYDGIPEVLDALMRRVKLAVLTGRRADLVEQRCRELSIGHVVGQSRAKGDAIERIAADLAIPLAEAAFMGDDVNDLPALRKVALSCAPADAAPEVLAEVQWVSRRPAGRGAVRELCEVLLAAKVGWPPPEEEPKPVPQA